MSFKCGIVGLPNVGKSTLFNALTKSNVGMENFPFCTIKPNIATVPVFDIRMNSLAEIVKPKKMINAFIEFVDIAGLVEGASKGEGLGNQFLHNIRETHAIVHVVRCFKNDHITHIYNRIDPIQDVNIINTELILSDFDTCEKAILKIEKNIKKCNADVKKTLLILKKCILHLKNFSMLHNLFLHPEEKKLINYLKFLTIKPTMYVANINEEKDSILFLDQLKEMAKKENAVVIPIYANLELDLSTMKTTEKKFFIKEFNIKFLGLRDIIIEGYKLLDLITFFTVGIKEIRAWSISKGSTSIQAAEKIHSDFGKGFIRAQIIAYSDFLKYKNESRIREAGKFRIEGKKYCLQDGDIVHFLFNV